MDVIPIREWQAERAGRHLLEAPEEGGKQLKVSQCGERARYPGGASQVDQWKG